MEPLENRLLLSASVSITTLIPFNNNGNGADPLLSMTADSSGDLFGVTAHGGGVGTIFELPAGDTTSIQGITGFGTGDGAYPSSPVLMDSSGDLFGVTSGGGSGSDGVIYEVKAGNNFTTTLGQFIENNNNSTSGFDGANPEGSIVMDSNGDIFGTTVFGMGTLGTVFELPAGTSTPITLAAFNGVNGQHPYGGLIADSSGNLYGTTSAGGSTGLGTIFEVRKGTSSIVTLATFAHIAGGAYPESGLIMDSSGNLYGTCWGGGSDSVGSIFELARGSHSITTLAPFTGVNGASPKCTLLMDPLGDLFGTATSGGSGSGGVVFELAHGSHSITDLVAFSTAIPANNTTNLSGFSPFGGLAMDTSGDLFGTTSAGGTYDLGTLFEIPSAVTIPHLVISKQPASVVAGNTGQDITVLIESETDGLVTTANSVVTLTVTSGPSRIVGVATAASSHGIATFTQWSLDRTGTYQITASDGDIPVATSSPIAITPAAASKLVVIQQPANTTAGAKLRAVKIAVEDRFGNVISSNGSTVTLSIASGPSGAILDGTSKIAALHGVATFGNLSLPTRGTYTLMATDGSLIAATTQKFVVS